MGNYSKIPLLSYNGASGPDGNGYRQVKRARLSSPMLQDVTNQVHASRASRRNTTDGAYTRSTRLMNKYVFGDAAVIEEVKKRERKIMKDIMHFKNAILEIEKETSQIRETQLPDIQYAISKKITMCNELIKENAQIASQLDLKDGEMKVQINNEELEMENLAVKHSIEKQEMENELKKELDHENLEWKKKFMELENMKPDKDIADEIRQLKEELNKVKNELTTLQQQNKEKCRQYEAELEEQLKEFQDSRKEPMDTLLCEQKKLKAKQVEFQTKREHLETHTKSLDKEIGDVTSQISQLKENVKESLDQNKPLKDRLLCIEGQHRLIKEQNDSLQEIAHKKEVYYNSKFDKMEFEQLRRRKLENSIDELRGEVRRFGYVMNDNSKFGKFQIDYAEKSLRKISTNESFYFTRMIPSSLVPESEFLLQEYEMYHEMCLQNGWHFNLISVSDDSTHSLKKALIDFIHTKCEVNYQVFLQYVYLSEEMPSQDMLLQHDREADNEIKLKIEEESLELDSKRIELTGDSDILSQQIMESKYILMSGIEVLKFQFIERSNLQGKPINFYFLEINDRKTLKVLDDVVTPDQNTASPIGLILKKLLSDTKPFLLFHIDNTKESEEVLQISQKIQKLKQRITRMKSNSV